MCYFKIKKMIKNILIIAFIILVMKIAIDITITPGVICKDYTILCEKKKDYQLLFTEITSNNQGTLDSGWFIQSKKDRKLVEIEPRLAKIIVNRYKHETLQFHNNLSGEVEGEIKGTIYLFGPNNIILAKNQKIVMRN